MHATSWGVSLAMLGWGTDEAMLVLQAGGCKETVYLWKARRRASVLGATGGDGEWQAECIEEEELLG
jgi:hypothetical protein